MAIADSNDVIYHLPASSECRWVRVDLDASYNAQLIVREGGACPGDSALLFRCSQFFYAAAGMDYYIIVDGIADAGPYEITVRRDLEEASCPGADLPIYENPWPFYFGYTPPYRELQCAEDNYNFPSMEDSSEAVYRMTTPLWMPAITRLHC